MTRKLFRSIFTRGLLLVFLLGSCAIQKQDDCLNLSCAIWLIDYNGEQTRIATEEFCTQDEIQAYCKSLEESKGCSIYCECDPL